MNRTVPQTRPETATEKTTITTAKTRGSEMKKRITSTIWTLTAIAGLVVGMTGAQASTIAYWTVDGGTVGNTITSETDSVASIEVEPFSDGTASYANGPTDFDTAASFDGNVGLESDPRSGTLTGLSALTAEAFVYMDSDPEGDTWNIFRKTALWSGSGNDGDSEDGFQITLNDGKPTIRLGREGGDPEQKETWDMATVIATQAVPTQQWVHVAGTWDGGTGELKLFVDGTEVSTEANGDFPTSLTGTLNDSSNDGPATIGAIDRGGRTEGGGPKKSEVRGRAFQEGCPRAPTGLVLVVLIKGCPRAPTGLAPGAVRGCRRPHGGSLRVCLRRCPRGE
ncbi:MAG: LamG domain-containing protein [Verrucomicrobiota bacterium]